MIDGKQHRKRNRGNGEGSIFKRSDGRWVSSLTIGYNTEGRQIRKDLYGNTRGEVKQNLDDAIHQVRNLMETRQIIFIVPGGVKWN